MTADARLRAIIAAFGADVLGGWRTCQVWRLNGKSYRAIPGQKLVRPDDVRRHLLGEHTIAVGPVQRAIVIDADLGAKHEAATEEAKQEAVRHISLILDTFGLPSLTFDSLRGVHTWLRLDRNPTQDELDALESLLGDGFEVYPRGGRAIRLPLGIYAGERRGPLTGGMADALLWLAKPERAPEAALAALLETGQRADESRYPENPVPEAQETPPSPGIEATQPPLTLFTPGEPPPAPSPITGWESWPRCKQRLAVEGPLAGHRHRAMLVLANEAVAHGEKDKKRLRAFLLAVPTPHSNTSAKEHRIDVSHAAKDALTLDAEDDPRRYTSCPYIPDHSNISGASKLRDTFERFCGEPGADAACPILATWHRGPAAALRFRHILDSPIWRDSRGAADGLGPFAKQLYEFMVRRGGGDENRLFPATINYLVVKLPGVSRRSIPALRDRLVAHNLIERPIPDKPWLFRLRWHDADWLRAKERTMAVTKAYDRERVEAIEGFNRLGGDYSGQ